MSQYQAWYFLKHLYPIKSSHLPKM